MKIRLYKSKKIFILLSIICLFILVSIIYENIKNHSKGKKFQKKYHSLIIKIIEFPEINLIEKINENLWRFNDIYINEDKKSYIEEFTLNEGNKKRVFDSIESVLQKLKLDFNNYIFLKKIINQSQIQKIEFITFRKIYFLTIRKSFILVYVPDTSRKELENWNNLSSFFSYNNEYEIEKYSKNWFGMIDLNYE